jgi:hypothetical protein
LVVVARRLAVEPVVVLVAARDGQARQFHAPGLPQLRLGGLDPQAAARLLAARVGRLAPQVGQRLLGETGGNPLALLGLPAARPPGSGPGGRRCRGGWRGARG